MKTVMLYKNLNPHKALIWRIIHVDNFPWVIENGLHAGLGSARSATWVNIGNEELISRRDHRDVPISPKGVLNDYVPFYFTPFSPMMYNIHTGRGGVKKLRNEEVIILVSSLHKIEQMGIQYVFTDRHAYPVTCNFYNDLIDLDKIDWPLLQQRNFTRNQDDPAQIERYQAEALVYKKVPVDALFGVICYTEKCKINLEGILREHNANMAIHHMPSWYF